MFIFRNICMIFVAMFLLGVTHSYAQMSIVVVDAQALMTQSNASKDVSKQLKKIRDDVVADLSKQEKALLSEEKQLVKAKDTDTKENFSKKVRAFEEKRARFQKLSASYRQKINESAALAEKDLRAEIVKVVENMAAERKYDLVLPKQNVIAGANALDMTDDAMKALNKALPSLIVKFDTK